VGRAPAARTAKVTLGLEFLDEIRAAHARIIDGPFKYEEFRSGIRRTLTRGFPYAVYFSVDDDLIVIIAVLDTARDPAGWQFRI
jgi:plasmid stabilization system protein ParE